MPLYDRVDGLSVPWGPRITLADTRLVIDPTLTYRSNLGAYDPAVSVRADLRHGWSATAFGGRTTLSNDRWIQSDLANSHLDLRRRQRLSELLALHPLRRARRARVAVHRR